jgi:nicotinamide-nucleotide amidase
MRACIIAVGSELLTPFRTDTNSLAITERLNAVGFEVGLKVIVGDDVAEVAEQCSKALSWADLLVVTGGLGPTEDDVTREALARVLDVPLDLDEAILERIRSRFARRALAMPAINRRQAMVPRGVTVIENPNGTAPGLFVERSNAAILLLPGPPREMTPMLDTVIAERLRPGGGGGALFRRVVRITGRTESDVDEHAQPIYGRWTARQPVPISTTILAVLGQIELHLTARAENRLVAETALDSAVAELGAELGDSIYSVDGRPLEAVVGDLLRAHRLTIAVAESCTGGLLTSRLTDVPGSSDYVDRAAVCYSNRAKVDWLGIPEALIADHGAVSEPVARAMASSIRSQAGVDIGVGVTGIAGPGGGTPEKPVGTVAIAVVTADETRVRTFQFFGGREMVKFQASQAALNMIRLMLIHASVRRDRS